MQRFWSWLAVKLGKHAGIVSIVGLIVTLAWSRPPPPTIASTVTATELHSEP